MTYRAWQITDGFGLDSLRLHELDRPRLESRQVRIRLSAVSLNFRDLLMVRGLYNPRQPLPLTPCADGTGEVVAVGGAVETVRVGDRVCVTFAQDWIGGEPDRAALRSTTGGPRPGTLAEEIVVPDHAVVRPPEHLSDIETATLPCAAVTAWSALVGRGRVQPGHTILVLGTGGVAIFALQIGQWLGARVIVTSSNDEKLARAHELGASATVNYATEPEWGRVVRDLSGGGVDHVMELGGAATLGQSVRATRQGGTISLIGNVAGARAEVDVIPIFMQRLTLNGILVGSKRDFEGLVRAATTHRLAPVVDTVVPFEEAPDAFRAMAAGGHFGKICVEL